MKLRSTREEDSRIAKNPWRKWKDWGVKKCAVHIRTGFLRILDPSLSFLGFFAQRVNFFFLSSPPSFPPLSGDRNLFSWKEKTESRLGEPQNIKTVAPSQNRRNGRSGGQYPPRRSQRATPSNPSTIYSKESKEKSQFHSEIFHIYQKRTNFATFFSEFDKK